jgi:hypothetical protein
LKWYWEHGHKREDQYEVSRGSCLDPLYAVRDRAAASRALGTDAHALHGVCGDLRRRGNPRCSPAIWMWTGTKPGTGVRADLERQAEPVRFGGELKSDGSNIVVNPLQRRGGRQRLHLPLRHDGRMVADPAFPVEITLATDTQILHALGRWLRERVPAAQQAGRGSVLGLGQLPGADGKREALRVRRTARASRRCTGWRTCWTC